jgi:hypothetical protein
MSNIPIAFYVLGALFTLYVVAATWQSKDAPSRVRRDAREPRGVSADRRMKHWWRARRHLGKFHSEQGRDAPGGARETEPETQESLKG